MPSPACTLVSEALSPPVAEFVLPPAMPIFSSRMTLAPLLEASVAAERPAPPAPMTTMSQVTSAAVDADAAAASPFAAARAVAIAPMVALEVIVAPDTVSSLAVSWILTIWSITV